MILLILKARELEVSAEVQRVPSVNDNNKGRRWRIKGMKRVVGLAETGHVGYVGGK